MKAKHLEKFRWNRKRIVSAILSGAVLLGSITFSALAWIRYEKRTNALVFKGTSLEIGLSGNESDTYPLIPGKTYQLTGSSIPKITIPANSVDCYVYASCEFYWYDLKYDVSGLSTNAEKQAYLYGYPLSTMYRETAVDHDPFNDTYRPVRPSTAAQGNDNDDGYTDHFGFQSAMTSGTYKYDIKSFLAGKGINIFDIKDENGNIIGCRYLFGFRTINDEVVFAKSNEDRTINILEGNDLDCKFTVNEFITKEQAAAIATNGKAPKMVFTGFAVQAAGLSRDDATLLVANAIADGSAQSGLLR